MPSLCCLQGAASPFGWAGIQRTPDPGEMALKSSTVRRRTHQGPVLLEAPSCPAWDSKDSALLGTVPILPFVKRGRSRAGTGDEHRLALQELQLRRRAQDTAQAEQLPGQDGRNQDTPRQGMATGSALCLSPPSSTPPPLGSVPNPTAPTAAATTHPLPRARLPSPALPYRSSLISFHTITLSSINAIGFPHAPPAPFLPPPLVREFFGPRDPVFSWMQGKHRVLGTVGGSHPAPARYWKKKPHKVRKDPTNHLSQQCTLVFVH